MHSEETELFLRGDAVTFLAEVYLTRIFRFCPSLLPFFLGGGALMAHYCMSLGAGRTLESLAAPGVLIMSGLMTLDEQAFLSRTRATTQQRQRSSRDSATKGGGGLLRLSWRKHASETRTATEKKLGSGLTGPFVRSGSLRSFRKEDDESVGKARIYPPTRLYRSGTRPRRERHVTHTSFL
jgi:hypothetical protein